MSKWTDIGESLQKARESMGLELMDVAHTTRIPPSTLKALEQSDYSVFPSPIYARSFLSQYSEFLEVNAQQQLEALEPGNVLANVKNLEYLKGQNDFIEQKRNFSFRKTRNRSAGSLRELSLSENKRSLLQTCTVLAITGLLIGSGVYTYQKLEPSLNGAQITSVTDQKNSSSSLDQDLTEVVENLANTEVTPVTAIAQNTPPALEEADPTLALLTLPKSGPPPRALVIEED